jgi:uncharacterized membrane protein SpoIIM required for sporulation/ABC-type transport system involved in multi-copper enzyme maturation permease subunit
MATSANTSTNTGTQANPQSTQAPRLQGQRTHTQTMANALIITRREVRDSFRDWRIIVPIVILTFFFPFLAQNVAASFSNFLAGFGAELIGERTIPFLLMIVGFFPISISLVIALETFVGEKERRSLEPLLSTPLTNTELYIGKTLAAMIPPLIASFGGMTVYMSTLLGSELAWRPPAMLIVQIFLLTIIQALVMVTGAVVVSSQTTSTRAANLLASFIIIPMALLINGESVIMFLAPDAESPRGIGALWAIMAGMFVVVVLLLRLGNSIFNREELLGRSLDALNLRGTLGRIWRNTRAVDAEGNTAKNLLQWYRRSIPYSLRNLRQSLWITGGVFLVAVLLGMGVGLLPEYRLPLPDQSVITEQFNIIEATLTLPVERQLQTQAFVLILDNNVRVLLAGLLLSVFSFGVMAYVITPITFVLLGYVLMQMLLSGYDILLYVAAVLPHGIIEIPVIVLATAVMFRQGAIVTKPPQGMTVGQAWMSALGDTLKLAIGVIAPGLIIAALIETYVTLSVVRAILGGL